MVLLILLKERSAGKYSTILLENSLCLLEKLSHCFMLFLLDRLPRGHPCTLIVPTPSRPCSLTGVISQL